MNSEQGSPTEHVPDDIRDTRIGIDETLCLFYNKLKLVIRQESASFRKELEEQDSDIRRDLVMNRPENEGSVNFKHLSCKNQFGSERIAEFHLADRLSKVWQVKRSEGSYQRDQRQSSRTKQACKDS